MGVVQRQGIKGTIVSYVGALLGAITILFVYPLCMNTQEIGLFRLILDTSVFFGLLSLLGSGIGITYFYPYYNDDAVKYNQFISFILLIASSGILITTLVFIFGKPYIVQLYKANSPQFVTYFFFLIPLVVIYNIFSLLESHAQNLYRIVVPKIAREIVLRIVIIVLLVLYYFKICSFSNILWLYVIALLCTTLFLSYYLATISPFKFSFTFRFTSLNNKHAILKYVLFVTIGFIGSILSNRLDSFFLSSTDNGLSKNGVYTTVVFMVMMIDLPIRSIISILNPLINESIKKLDLDKIESIYKKTSIYLLVLSLFIFALLWCNIDSIFTIMPRGDEFKIAKYVLLILGIGKIIDASTSINANILVYSQYYMYSLFFNIVLGCVTVATAFLFIPKFGLEGAALSTAFSMAMFQIIQTSYVYYKFKKHPFTLDTLKVFVCFAILITCVYYLPNINPILSIIYKSIILILASYIVLIKIKISKQVHEEIYTTVSSKMPSLAIYFK